MPKTTTSYTPEEFKALVQELLKKQVEIRFVVQESRGPCDQALGYSKVTEVQIIEK